MILGKCEPIATETFAGIRCIGVMTIRRAGAEYPVIIERLIGINIPHIPGSKVNSDHGLFEVAVKRLRSHSK